MTLAYTTRFAPVRPWLTFGIGSYAHGAALTALQQSRYLSRSRGGGARPKAEAMQDPEARKVLLQTAELWDRMAAYEQKHNPRQPNDPQ